MSNDKLFMVVFSTLYSLLITNNSMSSPAKKFEDLLVWQKAHVFVLAVYDATRTFPKTEIYGLTSQFRRAAISVAANIAEGF